MNLKNKFNKQHIVIGERTFVDKNSVIGAYTYIGSGCLISKATIGRYVSIGNNVAIGPGEHNIKWISTSAWIYQDNVDWYKELTKMDVWIGNDVWIGGAATIRRGVTVGDGAVIGANSFVNRDVPEFAVVAGVPAKIIKYRFDEHKIQIIKNSEWWVKDLQEAKRIVAHLEKTTVERLN